MNSLSLISSRVIGQSNSVTRPRSKSHGDEGPKGEEFSYEDQGRSQSDPEISTTDGDQKYNPFDPVTRSESDGSTTPDQYDEKQPLLDDAGKLVRRSWVQEWRRFMKRMVDALATVLGVIGAPVVYVFQCFRTDDGKFSAIPNLPNRRRTGATSKNAAATMSTASGDDTWLSEKPTNRTIRDTKLKHSYSSDSLSASTSESETDLRNSGKPATPVPSTKPSRRSSIRIKDQSDPALTKRKQKRGASPLNEATTLTVDNIKSPTSPSPSLKATRYPKAPQPPRPLVPRRQPSYSNLMARPPSRHPLGVPQQKTLILDLDETLIHSLAKGGRMSSGHMVEVKLNAPVALAPPQPNQPVPMLGPHHPILYYVHKRPHCDEFLRKVCKWYKLVVFTASVQEYADPVVDWLEQERKYFAGRYYRQHCTFRNGAYIKDLSSIEPDLSKVMILDNSPVSYIFHEDNAIPIEGWINDPTDNDLLHLIPMLEALQYVTDVRALLALRRGEAEAA